MSMFATRFVEPQELVAALARHKRLDPNESSPFRIIPLCGTWYLPNDSKARTGRAEYDSLRIANARFFDLDKICDTSSPYPHMLPDAATFQSAMRELGIGNDDTLVVYDSAELGLFSAPRVAWTLDVFGHKRVHILNNFKRWVDDGHPTVRDGECQTFEPSQYEARGIDASKVIAFESVKDLVECQDKAVQIIDARPHGRWAGSSPEPRPGLPSGHMPGSINIEFGQVLDPVTKTMEKDPAKLRALFESKGVRDHQPIVVSCGTGVTAAVIEAALRHAGFDHASTRIYDGSWTEWAQRAAKHKGLITQDQ